MVFRRADMQRVFRSKTQHASQTTSVTETGENKTGSQRKMESGTVTFSVSPEHWLVEANTSRQSCRPMAPGPGPQPTAANPLMTSATCAGTEPSLAARIRVGLVSLQHPQHLRALFYVDETLTLEITCGLVLWEKSYHGTCCLRI